MTSKGAQTGLSSKDWEFLYQELERTWNDFCVPIYHREIFTSYLETLGSNSAPGFIALEIDSIEKGVSPIIKSLESIQKREFLIGKLKTIHENSRTQLIENNILELEIANILVQLREITSQVIQSIISWKKSFPNVECEYYWNQICYIDKIKHDLDFLKKIGKFSFNLRDPFFLNTDLNLIAKKPKTMLKISKVQQKLFLKLEKYLSYGFGELRPIKLSNARSVNKTESDYVFSKKVPNRKQLMQLEQENYNLSLEIFENFVDGLVLQISSDCVKAEFYLQNVNFVSNLFFYQFLEEVVKADSEEVFLVFLLDYADDLEIKYIEEFLAKEVYSTIDWDLILFTEVACWLCDDLNYTGIVKLALSEIWEENNSLVEPVFEYLCNEVLKEKWVFDLIENITQPKEISHSIEEICEEVYFSYIQQYPGHKWIESIIQCSFKEIRGGSEKNLKKLMPI